MSRSPALRNGIGFGRVDWGDDGVDANAACTLAEIAPIDRVAIAQQMPRLVAQGVASIICRQTQAAVGLAVTLTWISSRRPWAMNTST